MFKSKNSFNQKNKKSQNSTEFDAPLDQHINFLVGEGKTAYKKKKKNVYDIVTDKIIQKIEETGEVVWNRNWSTVNNNPQNFISKKPYRGINRLLCQVLAESKYFLTFNQIKQLGGKLKKGSSSIPVIYWNFIYKDEDGKKCKKTDKGAKVAGAFLKYYNVFESNDIENIDFGEEEELILNENERIQQCENIVLNAQKQGLKLKHSICNDAYYQPILDFVQMPVIEQFNNSESYYSTLFHELIHWTGNNNRLDRFNLDNFDFGSHAYSQEELTAEIGSSFLCELTQIRNKAIEDNSIAYIKHWVNALKNDTKMIVKAGADAQKAVELITQGM